VLPVVVAARAVDAVLGLDLLRVFHLQPIEEGYRRIDQLVFI
jgi:hypothetical protein